MKEMREREREGCGFVRERLVKLRIVVVEKLGGTLSGCWS